MQRASVVLAGGRGRTSYRPPRNIRWMAKRSFTLFCGRACPRCCNPGTHGASLEFRHEIPPADSLAIAEGTALEQARRTDLNIGLHMTARGEIAIAGSRNGTARFRDGRLLAPVGFTLTAGAADAAETSLQVDFTVKGETVHQMELALK